MVISNLHLLDQKLTKNSSCKPIRNYQQDKVLQLLNFCTAEERSIHPRKFCRYWFGLDSLNRYGQPRYTELQILTMENEHGYREKCINLIAKILKVKPNTVHRWGKGVQFDKIPPDKRRQYETYLGYVYCLREIAVTLDQLDEHKLTQILIQMQRRLVSYSTIENE